MSQKKYRLRCGMRAALWSGRFQSRHQRGPRADETAIGEWSRQLAALVRGDGVQRREVIMVSSGAIAEGMKRGWLESAPARGP